MRKDRQNSCGEYEGRTTEPSAPGISTWSRTRKHGTARADRYTPHSIMQQEVGAQGTPPT